MSFSFGSPSTTTASTFGTSPSTGFSFSGGETKPLFGGAANTAAPAATNAGSAFGASKPLSFGGFSSPPNQTVGSPGFGQPAGQNAPQNLSFGGAAQTAPTFGTPTTQASAFGSPSGGSFSFGPAATTTSTGFAFNTPASGFSAPLTSTAATTTTPQTSQPFGSGTAFGQTSAFGKPTGFGFGAAATAAPTFGGSTPAPGFGTTPAQPQPQQTGLNFGTATTSAAGLSFGQPQTQTGLSFGTSATQQSTGLGLSAPASQPQQTGLTFGTPATQPQPGLSFGTATPQPQTQSGLSFGTATTQPQTQSGLSFGTATQPQTQQQTGLGFGTPATQSTGISFGTATTNFGTAPTTSVPNFAPSSTSGFGAATRVPAATGFNFSADHKPSGLSFGTAASNATTTTSGPSFGTAASSTTAGLSFGTPASSVTSTGLGFGTTPAVQTPGLSFGPPKSTTATTGLSLAPTTTTAGLSFGTPASTTTSGIGFGTTTTATTGLGFGTTPTTGLSFGTATSTGIGFGKPTATVAASSVASTTTPSGITALGKPTATTTLPSLTTTTATTAAPLSQPQPFASINFAQLEENINKWTLELEEQEKTFINQATQINAWDRLLIANGEKIVELNEAVTTVKNEQTSLEHELDFVLGHQKELEDLLAPLEKNVLENNAEMARDPEREHLYSLAENLDTQLRQMSEDLKEVIEHLNETNRSQDSNDPIVQIGRILNAHMSSMQWIDNSIAQISTKLDQLKATHDTLRRDNERSFQLTYN